MENQNNIETSNVSMEGQNSAPVTEQNTTPIKPKRNWGFTIFACVATAIIVALSCNLGDKLAKNNDSDSKTNNTEVTSNSNSNEVSNETSNEVSNVTSNETSNTTTEQVKCPTNNEEKPKVSVNRQTVLGYYKSILTGDISKNKKYAIVDLNNDNIPELFLYNTGSIGNEILGYIKVYMYDENRGSNDSNYLVPIGTLWSRYDNDTHLYKMKDGSLLSVFVHGGYTYTEEYNLLNNNIVHGKITEMVKFDGVHQAEGDEFINLTDATDLSALK